MTINQFTLHDTASAPKASVATLEAVQKAWNFVPNLHRVLAESPVALEAYSQLFTLADNTSFTPVERHVAYLAIIFENECTYCMAGHTNLSRMAGVAEADIQAVRDDAPLEDARLQALRVFAAAVTRQRGAVSTAQVDAFKAAGFDNQAILDLLVLASAKLISNYTNHLAGTPLDGFMKGAEWQAPGRLNRA